MKKDFEFASKLLALIEQEYDVVLKDHEGGRQTAIHGQARRVFCFIVRRKTRLAIRQIAKMIGCKNHSSIMSIAREWKDGKLEHLKTEIVYFENLLNRTYEKVNR